MVILEDTWFPLRPGIMPLGRVAGSAFDACDTWASRVWWAHSCTTYMDTALQCGLSSYMPQGFRCRQRMGMAISQGSMHVCLHPPQVWSRSNEKSLALSPWIKEKVVDCFTYIFNGPIRKFSPFTPHLPHVNQWFHTWKINMKHKKFQKTIEN